MSSSGTNQDCSQCVVYDEEDISKVITTVISARKLTRLTSKAAQHYVRPVLSCGDSDRERRKEREREREREREGGREREREREREGGRERERAPLQLL